MENKTKEKCTIKKRREVARILAARDNFEKIQKKHIDAVGLMSDEDILQFLHENIDVAAGPVEILKPENVEELTPGGGSGDVLYNSLRAVVENFILSNNWDGEKISPLQWAACCMAAGRFARSHSLFRGVPEDPNTNDGIKQINALKGINTAAVAAAVPVWLSLCYRYNKTPLKCDFIEFCGLSHDWLYDFNNSDGVTSARADLLKKLNDIQADGLRRKILNSKESPIGGIFLLKADHGLVEATKVQHEYIKNDLCAADLPVFGPDPDEIPEKP